MRQPVAYATPSGFRNLASARPGLSTIRWLRQYYVQEKRNETEEARSSSKSGGLRNPGGRLMLLYSCNLQSRDPQKTTDKSAPTVRGTVAAPFELLDLEGESTRLQDFKGKVVLLNFWEPPADHV